MLGKQFALCGWQRSPCLRGGTSKGEWNSTGKGKIKNDVLFLLLSRALVATQEVLIIPSAHVACKRIQIQCQLKS